MTKRMGGYPQSSVETYDTLLCGTIATGAAQVPLVATPTPCYRVTVQADPDNGGAVFVGNAAGCSYQLNASGTVVIRINDVSKVCVRGAGQTVNWLAEA